MTFASIFSGCGGFDTGFIQAGFRPLGAFDNDPEAVNCHRLNLGTPAEVCDLTGHSSVLNELKPDVLIAGPPCQGFSTVGKRDVDDPRNSLLVLAGELAARIRPRVFILENVSGVVAGEHRKYWEVVHAILKEAGYATTELVCDASTLGVAQRRRRILLIARRGKADVRASLPTIPRVSVDEALRSVWGLSNHEPKRLDPRSVAGIVARHIRQGQKLSNVRSGPRAVHTWQVPEVYGQTTSAEREVLEAAVRLRRQSRRRDYGDADPITISSLSGTLGKPARNLVAALVRKGYMRRSGRLVDLTHTFNGKYRRLLPAEPSPTVDTHFGDPRLFLHPRHDRGMTVREAARLQGFPDSFQFQGAVRTQYRLIGNAVPPPMAKHVAEYVARALLK